MLHATSRLHGSVVRWAGGCAQHLLQGGSGVGSQELGSCVNSERFKSHRAVFGCGLARRGCDDGQLQHTSLLDVEL